MQQSDNNQSNPWSLIQRNAKFDCPYFTAHSDTVTHRGGKQRSYNHIRRRQFELGDYGLEFGHAWLLGLLEPLGLDLQFEDLRFDGFKG